MTAGTQAARQAAANPWTERLARLGLGASGVLFIVIGILAFRVALGHTEDQASQNGALQEIASKPGGKVLIWIIAIGLITEARQAEEIVASGKADMVALARGMLYDPRWGWHAAAELGGQVSVPPQYWRSQPSTKKALFGNTTFGGR